LLLAEADGEAALACAMRPATAVPNEEASRPNLSLSIGLAVVAVAVAEGTRTPEALELAADDALYRAKREGRSRIAVEDGEVIVVPARR
jgi:GGDEF domain-containing protein